MTLGKNDDSNPHRHHRPRRLLLGAIPARQGLHRIWHLPRTSSVTFWRILQADEPDTFLLATSRTETVRDFVRIAFKGAGIAVDFKCKEENETAIDIATGKTIMRINPKFYRPAEVKLTIGNSAHAKAKLGWEPKTMLVKLCQIMVEADLRSSHAGFSF